MNKSNEYPKNQNVPETTGQLSRRNFLKHSAVVGTAAVLATITGCATNAPTVADPKKITWDHETDVVIAGSGGGLLAACDAADAGCKVILIEKSSILGGECILNEGWINGAGSKVQAAEGVVDNAENFAKDWAINHANNVGFEDPEIIKTYHSKSGVAIDRMVELGAKYVLAQDGQFFGSAPRAHIIQPNASAWAAVLKKAAEQRGVTIMTETPLTSLIVNEKGEVIGVEANKLKIKARKGLILATGDTSANKRMKAKFQPKYAAIDASCNSNTGDGYFAALEIGADSSQMQNTNVGPCQTFSPEGSALNSYVLGKGLIMVNKQGKRYGNESDYSGIATAQHDQPEEKSFGIFDSHVAAITHKPNVPVKEVLKHLAAGECCPIGLISGVGPAYLEDYLKAGTIVEAQTLEELAKKLGIDAAELAEQAAKWNAAVAAGVDKEFSRPMMKDFQYGDMVGIKEGPFYGLIFDKPRWFVADGPNLMVDTKMHILDVKGAPIPRLYGAGAGLCGGTGTLYTNTCGDHMGFTAVSSIIAAAGVAAETSWEAK